MGLLELTKMDVCDCLVVGDSSTAKGMGSWQLAPLIYEIRDLSSFLRVSFVQVPRDQNPLADS